MASLKQTLYLYSKILASGSAIGYAYLHYRCKKLREEAMNQELINAKKDTTRPTNEYYGLNWGYRSDNTIEKSLDTGDILFYNYNCMNCFHPSDVIKCYLQQYKLKSDEPQNTAFCFRTPKKLLVITSHFDGQVQITPYHEFLNKPFISTVKVRSFKDAPLNLVDNSMQFVQQMKQLQQKNENDNKDYFTKILKYKLIKWFYFDKISSNVVPHYLYSIKVLNKNPFQKPYITSQDLDKSQPECFHVTFELSNPIMIRTSASQNLQKSNLA